INHTRLDQLQGWIIVDVLKCPGSLRRHDRDTTTTSDHVPTWRIRKRIVGQINQSVITPSKNSETDSAHSPTTTACGDYPFRQSISVYIADLENHATAPT